MLSKWLERLQVNRNEDGFSLTELMIVVVIIGIIAAIAIPIYSNQVREAEIATLKSDVQSTATAFKQWQNKQGSVTAYPKGTAAQINAELAKMTVKSDPTNSIVFKPFDITNDHNNFEVCIEGSRNFGGSDIVRWNYNLYTDKFTEGVCVNSPYLTEEKPS